MMAGDAVTIMALIGLVGLGIVLVVAFREGDWRDPEPPTVDRDRTYEEGA